MESKAMSPNIRLIDDGGSGDGQRYECDSIRVWLNYQGETMLYTGQLLLIKDELKNAARTTPCQRLPRRRTQTHSSPNEDQKTATCSKIFSALKDADLQFNSSGTTATCTTSITTDAIAAEGTSWRATDSSTTTSTCVKTSASKPQSTKSFPIFNLSITSSASANPSKNVPVGENSAGQSSSTEIPFVSTTIQKKGPKTTPDAKSATSSGLLNNSLPVIGNSWDTGSQKKKNNSSPLSFWKAQDQPKTGAKERVSKDNVGASKLPFPSSLEDHHDLNVKSGEGNDRKNVTKMKKVSDFEKDEGDNYTRRGKARREAREKENSNSLPKELLKAQLKCFQIQHSLYGILVTKLRSKESKSELLHASNQLSSETESDDLQSLLLPLETLLRCSDIQLGLHHSLDVALDSETGRLEDDGEDTGCSYKENVGHMIYDKDELLIESRSLMNNTKFAQSLVCLHLSNPYSSNLRYACGEDRIFSYESLFQTSNLYVPHGEGKLVSLDGNLIYEGQWKKGKRWGHGKAFIFSGHELSASKKQYGIYEGQWWNNMRHGHGRLVFASCTVYEGEWQYDLMSGVGAMHSPDGSVLEGLWDEDEPSGCGMFTWPNGAVEYREYQNGQVIKVLGSTEETKKISPLNEVMREYSILRLKYQMLEEDKNRLVQSELKMKVQQTEAENSKKANQAKVKEMRVKFAELLRKYKKKVLDKHHVDLQEMNERHDKRIKDLEDKINQIETELEGKKSDLLCQICFEHYRDCILMPCSHLLYCQTCIAKLHADVKPARCPVCRGPINSQINCNLNQLEQA